MMLEVVGQFGTGLPPPTRYSLCDPLLKHEVERTKSLLKKNEEEWKEIGCSIMTDAWFDRKRRSIMNLCVNSRMGTVFISSKECSNESHTSQYIYDYEESCIQQVGPDHVVQVVTDNVTNNMGAAKLLQEKRPTIFWTSCSTHTINLMLESIGGLPRFGADLAIKGCMVNNAEFDPARWWGLFGGSTPHLKRIAMRILSLTSSSSGCERNWSTFEAVHTKKQKR
ncbi:unnamed protein product [Lactuca saligna]|uniref:DUF659 domain-containing protein n=1 Tax=Lactuca saligna TaxID=75948 RepID=A0AA36DWW7_LACSI|nr:unnamed protein product [Lactuca saligna]